MRLADVSAMFCAGLPPVTSANSLLAMLSAAFAVYVWPYIVTVSLS